MAKAPFYFRRPYYEKYRDQQLKKRLAGSSHSRRSATLAGLPETG
ncbi:MAG: hypothetical protein V4693_09675 [Pseudomonadota bacterium]